MTIKKFTKYLIRAIIFILAVAFIIKLAGPSILKQYISYGIGSCKNIPILCKQPEEKIFTPEINKEYAATLIPQSFPKMSVAAPKGFTIVQELIKKTYYKKRQPYNKSIIYLLFQEPEAFIKLYPDVKKQGIMDNRAFISRLMAADLDKINNITDAFFVIMKSIFTPDVGNQTIVKMIKFRIDDKNGFINYTLAKPESYFDCNVLDTKGNFFKVYIKDAQGRLDLDNVFAIISTLKPS